MIVCNTDHKFMYIKMKKLLEKKKNYAEFKEEFEETKSSKCNIVTSKSHFM